MAEKRTGRTGGSSGGKPKPTLERGMGKNAVTRAYLNSGSETPKIKKTPRSGGRPKPASTGGGAARTPIATAAKNLVTGAARRAGGAVTRGAATAGQAVSRAAAPAARAGSVALRVAGSLPGAGAPAMAAAEGLNTLAKKVSPPKSGTATSDVPTFAPLKPGETPKVVGTPIPKPTSTTKPKASTNAKPKTTAPKSIPAGSSKPKAQQAKSQGEKAGGYSQATKDWAWAERERMLMQRDQARIKRGGK